MTPGFGNFGYFEAIRVVCVAAVQRDLGNEDACSFKLCVGGNFIFRFACVYLEVNYELRVLKIDASTFLFLAFEVLQC
jgi:hypothetical protein